MKKELDDLLVSKYPKIFKNRNASMLETAMCWGFDCRNGWFWLLDNLCKCIQSYLDNNPHLKVGQVVATQVKEKYGSLRFYYEGGNETIHGMVWLAEHQSYNICEECGATEDIGNTAGWISIRCKTCAEKEGLISWKPYSEKDEEDGEY